MKENKNKENAQAPEYVTLRPPADVEEAPEGVTIIFEMPGASSADIGIEAGNGMLKIEGKSSLHRKGMPVVFKRSFYISDAVDVDKISATAGNGLLTVHLPKAEHAIPKKIAVN
jgi:HSP20 family molecular chaperone IbpA